MFVPFTKVIDGLESHLAVNHLAHFLLFQELYLLLGRTAERSVTKSRVISVSSSGHHFSEILFDNLNFEREDSYDSIIAYGQSTTANIYMANSISRVYAQQNIVGLYVHPGVILGTDIYRHMSAESLISLDKKRERRHIKS